MTDLNPTRLRNPDRPGENPAWIELMNRMHEYSVTEDWERNAACADPGAPSPFDPALRSWCRRCPVKSECESRSDERQLRVGVWGGTLDPN